MFTPLALWIFPRLASDKNAHFIIITGELALLCRAISGMLDTSGKLIACGLGAGLFLLFFPALLWMEGNKGNLRAAFRMGCGLALAVLLSILLRSVFAGNDISDYGNFRAIPWLLALAAGVALPALAAVSANAADVKPSPARHAPWRASLQVLGIASVFVLLYFAFSAPTVISRWTDFNYPTITLLLVVSTWLFLAAWLAKHKAWENLSPGLLFAWNLLFVAAVTFTVWSYQTPFPADVPAYPLFEMRPDPLAKYTIVAMLLLSPVLFIDFSLLVRGLIDENLSLRGIGGSFSLAALYLLVMILMQIFTTVYDYIPVAGAWFRNQFWITFLAPGLVLLLALLVTRPPIFKGSSSLMVHQPLAVLVVALVLALASGLAVVATVPHPENLPPVSPHNLRILTFNIQQGYSQSGVKNFTGQLEAIRSANPDIIGLEETDNARISGGNSDVVRFFTQSLNYYSYYGPKTTVGTFGVALLSRYPIQNPRTFFMYSTGEQTAAIEAQIAYGGKTFNVVVTHLGNGGPLVQQEEVLAEVDRLNPAANIILVGDFNFSPADPPYKLTMQKLKDAWKSAELQGTPQQGLDVENRIDHVFLSPGTRVIEADFTAPGPSDHPMLVVEVGN